MYPLSGPQPYPRNQWYVAAWSTELHSDALTARTILGIPLVLFRDEHGEAVALDDRCPHRRFPLSKGEIANGVVTCGYHGFAFNGRGECVHVPSQTRAMSSQKTPSYRVRETWNWVWIWMGDPALAEDTPLPDHSYVHAEDTDWKFVAGGAPVLKARYMLLHDNILDLSHLSFLHRNTVGSPGIAAAKVHTIDLPNGLEMSREVLGDNMHASPLGASLGIEGPVDRSMPQQFLAPCLHITGPEFRSAADGGVDPGHLFGAFRVVHAIVPETPTTTHYFWGFTRNFRQDDESMTEALRRNILAAVTEDIDASEDIERLLGFPGAPGEIHSPADAAGAKGRRIMQRLLDAEDIEPSRSQAKALETIGTRS